MERVSGAWMATVKLQGWIHAARGMEVPDSATTELNSDKKLSRRFALRAEGQDQIHQAGHSR